MIEKRKDLNEKMGANSFIIAMDNYFTLPKVIYALRNLGIGIVGTAKYSKAWPPLCLKKIDDKKSNFNDFFGQWIHTGPWWHGGWTMACFFVFQQFIRQVRL